MFQCYRCGCLGCSNAALMLLTVSAVLKNQSLCVMLKDVLIPKMHMEERGLLWSYATCHRAVIYKWCVMLMYKIVSVF